ncbi:MAG: hypothetical protein H6553_12030 [Chitinophagales bacterium]|nr:hypothetical protein [Chitinophagales bacterium]
MKKLSISFFVLALFMLFTTQCKKEDNITTSGIPEQVTSQIPDSLFQVLKDLGMPIYEGNSPTTINGIYIISPNKLKNSNISGDVIGHVFVPDKIKFESQDNNKREVYFQKKNTISVSSNELSYTSGEGDYFTVYSIVNNFKINTDGDTTDIQQFLFMFSGKKSSNSDDIEDLYYSLLSTKEIKNTTNAFIKVGEGRVIYDSDKITVSTNTFRLANEDWTPSENYINPLTLKP